MNYQLASGGSTRIAAMNGVSIPWDFVLTACNEHDANRERVIGLELALNASYERADELSEILKDLCMMDNDEPLTAEKRKNIWRRAHEAVEVQETT